MPFCSNCGTQLPVGGNFCTNCGIIDARDKNKQYRTVDIGNQVWMAENLNYKVPGGKCCGQKYGMLYDWETANKACPSGWHLPNKEEWDELMTTVGGKPTAAKHLKAKSGWKSSYNGEDTYGFSALPDGGSQNGSSDDVSNYGTWWSSDEYNANEAYYLSMHHNDENAHWTYDDKKKLFSVRCIKD